MNSEAQKPLITPINTERLRCKPSWHNASRTEWRLMIFLGVERLFYIEELVNVFKNDDESSQGSRADLQIVFSHTHNK